MIDIIASAAISVLVPLLKKGVEAFSGEAGKRLYQWVADKFKSHNKQKDLEDLGKDPDNAKLQGKVETTIENILNQNRSLIEEFKKLVENAKSETVIIDSKNVITGNFQSYGNMIIGDGGTIISSEPTVGELISSAKNCLDSRDYKNAYEYFKKSISKTPNNADLYYYSALSLIAGRRPKILGMMEAEEVVRNINMAINKDTTKAHFYYLKAIMLYDFYYLNGFTVDIDDINDLISTAANVTNDIPMIKRMLLSTPNIDKEIAGCIPLD